MLGRALEHQVGVVAPEARDRLGPALDDGGWSLRWSSQDRRPRRWAGPTGSRVVGAQRGLRPGQEAGQQLVDAVESHLLGDPGLVGGREPAELRRQRVDRVDAWSRGTGVGPRTAGAQGRRSGRRGLEVDGRVLERRRSGGDPPGAATRPGRRTRGPRPRRRSGRPARPAGSRWPTGAPCPGGRSGVARSTPARWGPARPGRPGAHRRRTERSLDASSTREVEAEVDRHLLVLRDVLTKGSEEATASSGARSLRSVTHGASRPVREGRASGVDALRR